MASVLCERINPFQVFLSGLLYGSLFSDIVYGDIADMDVLGSCCKMDKYDNANETQEKKQTVNIVTDFFYSMSLFYRIYLFMSAPYFLHKF